MQWRLVFPMSSRRRSSEGKDSSRSEGRRGLLSKRRRGGSRDDSSRGGTDSASTMSTHSALQIGEDASPDAPWRVENIRVNGPPSDNEWWVAAADSSIEVKSVESSSASSKSEEEIVESEKVFHNCGRATWVQVQQAWRIPTVTERPERPAPVKRKEVMNGLSVVARKYELPGRMSLTDVVDIYQDIWD